MPVSCRVRNIIFSSGFFLKQKSPVPGEKRIVAQKALSPENITSHTEVFVKTKGITIDQLGIENHNRWAVDQEKLDVTHIQDSNLIPDHSEIAGTSSIYSSKWAELFDFQQSYITWAAFVPPPDYEKQRNRFFSFDITPNFRWLETEEGEEEEKNQQQLEECKERLRSKKPRALHPTLVKRDQSALISMLDSMKSIHDLLREIQGKKLQYQKG